MDLEHFSILDLFLDIFINTVLKVKTNLKKCSHN